MSIAWQELFAEIQTISIEEMQRIGQKIRDAVRVSTPELLQPHAEQSLALLAVDPDAIAPIVTVVAFAVVCQRARVPLARRFHKPVVRTAARLKTFGLTSLAAEGLRACSSERVRRTLEGDLPDIELLGHIGDPATARRCVVRVCSWTHSGYGLLLALARRKRIRRQFEMLYGYDRTTFTHTWIRGLAAYGATIAPTLIEALRTGKPQEALLFQALGAVGNDAAVAFIAKELTHTHRRRRRLAHKAAQWLSREALGRVISVARSCARGKPLQEIDSLDADVVGNDTGVVETLFATQGASWELLPVCADTMRSVAKWWVLHLRSAAWNDPRPAWDAALDAHRNLDETATIAAATLGRLDRGAADTVNSIMAVLGERGARAVHAMVQSGGVRLLAETVNTLIAHWEPGSRELFAAAVHTREGDLDALLGGLLATGNDARDVAPMFLTHSCVSVRLLAARVCEILGMSEEMPPMDRLLCVETDQRVQATLRRAMVMHAHPQTPACAVMDELLCSLAQEPVGKYVPAVRVLPTLSWNNGVTVSQNARRGLLHCLDIENLHAPSPLAHRVARLLDVESADAWAMEFFIERPTLADRPSIFRAVSSFVLLSERRLLAFSKRQRRRTRSNLDPFMRRILLRRNSTALSETICWFP